jgi:large subunit ribosomal protein L4
MENLSKKEIMAKAATTIEKKTPKAAELSVALMGHDGKADGTIALPTEIFAAKVNPTLMAQAVRVYLANQRQGTARTQTRGDVTASTRKIYRQKGTGRARHGALSAPLFVGGGTTFGPKPRDFSLDFPKKMKKAALHSALTQKLSNNQVIVMKNLDGVTKTKDVALALKALQLVNKKGKGHKVLLVTDGAQSVKQIVRNVEGVDLANVSTLSTYAILNHNHILFIENAVAKMTEVKAEK